MGAGCTMSSAARKNMLSSAVFARSASCSRRALAAANSRASSAAVRFCASWASNLASSSASAPCVSMAWRMAPACHIMSASGFRRHSGTSSRASAAPVETAVEATRAAFRADGQAARRTMAAVAAAGTAAHLGKRRKPRSRMGAGTNMRSSSLDCTASCASHSTSSATGATVDRDGPAIVGAPPPRLRRLGPSAPGGDGPRTESQP
mmetsp:Transcript_75936/g.212899  ORF Transcript_75936/g.212899 Transcript_75936/m.212899 type:complete len:206 (+) Transcript_75936:775-1392(+)